ncbi:hypothetical protein [Moorena producens]|uniref:hypothetical protein n=1 Tax=Moorena producens TaxID=1155739 RepID=UPI003C70988E
MKEVLGYIRNRTNQAKQNPFILWLDDDSISARDRLSLWLPHISAFVMGFMDLNKLIFPYPSSEAATDELKRLINHHCLQDGTHWEWYLRDLQKLELNRTMKFSEGLEFIYGDHRKLDRAFIYGIVALAHEAQDPLLRYSLIAPLEFFAHLLFGKTAPIARKFAEETGTQLEYVGDIHSGVEPGGLVNQQHQIIDEDLFTEAVLDEQMRKRGLEMAEYMCDQIELRWKGNLEFAKKREWATPIAVV